MRKLKTIFNKLGLIFIGTIKTILFRLITIYAHTQVKRVSIKNRGRIAIQSAIIMSTSNNYIRDYYPLLTEPPL